MEFNLNSPSGDIQTVLVLLAGIATLSYGAYGLHSQTSALSDSVEVNASIESTGVEEVSQRRGTGYEPEATFTYSFEGESYRSSNFYPGLTSNTFSTREDALSEVSKYGNGSVTAYVDPESPEKAFLKKEKSNTPLMITGIGTVMALVSLKSILAV